MKNIFTGILTLLVFSVFINSSQAQTYVVIINKSNTVQSLSKKQVSDLFLKKSNWDNGSKPIPVDLPANSSIRTSFSKEIHGKPTGAIRNYWQQAAFSGTASAPPEKKSDEEVIDFVKNNPGAVGYVSSDANLSEVKQLKIN